MPIDHEQAAEQIDAWALGALDGDEATQLERHLDGCADCTLLADAARDTAAAIAMAVPLRAAGEPLKAKVMASAAVLHDVPRTARRNSFRLWPVAAAASIAIGAGFVGYGTYAQAQLGDLRDDRAQVRAAATAESEKLATASTQLVFSSGANKDLAEAHDALSEILARPDMIRLSFTPSQQVAEASARYVWSPSAGLGSLVARGLPVLEEGMTYCLWAVYEGDWIAAGTFNVDDGGTGRLIVRALPTTTGTAGRLLSFAVTEEKAASVIKHEGTNLLEARVDGTP